MTKSGTRPVHPGKILRKDYMQPAGLSANALARALHVTPARINEILRQQRGITADTALRLARYFGGDARAWLELQLNYDLRVAEIAKGKRIEKEVIPAGGEPVSPKRKEA